MEHAHYLLHLSLANFPCRFESLYQFHNVENETRSILAFQPTLNAHTNPHFPERLFFPKQLFDDVASLPLESTFLEARPLGQNIQISF